MFGINPNTLSVFTKKIAHICLCIHLCICLSVPSISVYYGTYRNRIPQTIFISNDWNAFWTFYQIIRQSQIKGRQVNRPRNPNEFQSLPIRDTMRVLRNFSFALCRPYEIKNSHSVTGPGFPERFCGPARTFDPQPSQPFTHPSTTDRPSPWTSTCFNPGNFVYANASAIMTGPA